MSVLHRPVKEGIGPAYVAGFRWAVAEGAELVLEMDCDFSHDPADVLRLIEATADADLVLARATRRGEGRRTGVSPGGSSHAADACMRR